MKQGLVFSCFNSLQDLPSGDQLNIIIAKTSTGTTESIVVIVQTDTRQRIGDVVLKAKRFVQMRCKDLVDALLEAFAVISFHKKARSVLVDTPFFSDLALGGGGDESRFVPEVQRIVRVEGQHAKIVFKRIVEEIDIFPGNVGIRRLQPIAVREA